MLRSRYFAGLNSAAITLCALAISCSEVPEPRTNPVADDTQALSATATLSGRVFAGDGVQRRPPIKITIDEWECGREGTTPDPRLVLGPDRGLADVVITLVSPPGDDPYPLTATVTMEQQACVFRPHLSVVAPGTEVKVTNGDKVFHNFRTRAKLNKTVNRGQPSGIAAKAMFSEPEIVVAECDVHHWMSAVIVVAPHRYITVSDSRGRFSIDGLPAGEHQVRLWHQELGEREALLRAGGENPAIVWSREPSP